MTPKEKAEAIKKQLVVINQLLKKPENKLCADCKKINPTWASVNLGVFVCINCSGCHREIGVHITKIRSVNLDVWPQEVLNNFKIINNKIANKYWECKLKNFNFKSIQGDNHKLVQFIRDKYENKKWIDSKKKIDPMTLIIKGKIKKYKKLFCESEDEEEDEEEDQSDDDRKNKKNKNKKKKKDKDVSEDEEDDNKHKKKKKNNKDDDSEDSDEEEDKGKKKKKEDNDEEDDDDEEGEENEEDDNKNKKNKNKNDEEEDDDFEEVKEKKIYESKSPITQRPPQLSNNLLFEMNLNQNKQNNLNLNFNNNNANSANNLSLNNNNNIVDIFNQQTPADKKSQDLMNNINNAYFSPQPTNSSRFNSMFQQMPNNMGLNLQNKNNNIQNNNMNNYQNMGSNNNIMNINHVHSMQNVHMNMNNNNMYNMNNNMNYGMNNFAGMNNNMNSMNNGMQNNMNNNMNFNNNNNNLKHTTSSTIPSNNPSFNMEYFNQNLTGGKKNKAESTYNFSKNKVDPFSNLVSFKK